MTSSSGHSDSGLPPPSSSPLDSSEFCRSDPSRLGSSYARKAAARRPSRPERPSYRRLGSGSGAIPAAAMFSSDQKPSPRREVRLQGPRPTPLKVSKDSHRIRKPPVGPSHQPPPPPPPLPRAPVIIYAVSPKVIHTTPGDFMSLVQRLTGTSPTHLPHPAAAAAAVSLSRGPVSPAARLAAVEGSCLQSFPCKAPAAAAAAARDPGYYDLAEQLGMDIAATLDMANLIPGILSPLPTALPTISPGFFSPPPEPGSMAFMNEMSPVFRAEGPFLPSPGNLLFTPTFPSPGALWDILGQL